MSLHDLQSKVYDKKQGPAVGFIKFTDYPSSLKNGQIYFSNVYSFCFAKPPIGDRFEGYLLDTKPSTSYKDIFSFCYSNCESYISCFTTLFESDFDVEGNIKESTVERLKELDSDSNDTKDIPRPPRSAVIFPCDIMMSCFSAVNNSLYLLRGVKNGELEVFDKDNEKLLFRNPFPKTYAALEKSLFGFDIQTFRGAYVHYADPECIRTLTNNDQYDLEIYKDKKDFFKKSDKYLSYCLLEKKKVVLFGGHNYRYDDQHEFRVMFIFFEDKKSKELPKNLTLNFQLDPQDSKIITNENLGNIKRSYFNTTRLSQDEADRLKCVSLIF